MIIDKVDVYTLKTCPIEGNKIALKYIKEIERTRKDFPEIGELKSMLEQKLNKPKSLKVAKSEDENLVDGAKDGEKIIFKDGAKNGKDGCNEGDDDGGEAGDDGGDVGGDKSGHLVVRLVVMMVVMLMVMIMVQMWNS